MFCKRDCLQKARCKYRGHEYLLFQRHTQPPDARHWKYQNCKIRDDVENASSLESSVNAETVTRGHEWVPDLLARDTNGDFKDCLHEIEDQVAPDA